MRIFLVLLTALAVTSCEYTEVEREIGYKGKARVNPWLAAERFAGHYGGEVKSLATWTAPGYDDALWFVPAAVLGNESFTRQVEEWVSGGGHLVLLVQHAETETNDWSGHANTVKVEPALKGMLARSGITILSEESPEATASKVEFEGKSYEVDAKSSFVVSAGPVKKGMFASVRKGDGRISVLTDARLFRNRWIGDKQHADLLAALMAETEYGGGIGFIRGTGLSLWSLLAEHLWPLLIGLGGVIVLWLWKNFTRFGPLEAVSTAPVMRGYERHLEALGDFQWRLDRAAALLTPLRALIVERGQRVSVRSGRRDDDFFQFLADRSGLARERVHRALVEQAPPDSGVLTRTTADLQRLLEVLH